MSAGPTENHAIAAPVGNPIVDAWNDAADTTQAFEPEYRSPLDVEHVGVTPTSAEIEPITLTESASTVALAIARIPGRIWVATLVMFAILLVLSTAYDFTTIIPPSGIAGSRWRFAFVGAAAPKLLKVMGAAVLASLAIALSERRMLALMLSAVLGLGALVLMVMTPLFLMDALQMRAILNARMAGKLFVYNVGFVMVLLVVMSGVLASCALALRKVASWFKLDLNSPEKVVNREWDR